jgi:hypothetical protein
MKTAIPIIKIFKNAFLADIAYRYARRMLLVQKIPSLLATIFILQKA